MYIASKYCLDMNYSRYIPRKRFNSLYLSRMLLKEILHINYKIRYNNYIKEKMLPINKPIMANKCTQTDTFDAEETTKENIDIKNTSISQESYIENTEQFFRL